MLYFLQIQSDFNPLPPCGGRHQSSFFLRCVRGKFQSTPSVWRETLLITAGSQRLVISIHSLRVEGDMQFLVRLWMPFHFNPLPPCGGRRCCLAFSCSFLNFNPLPPCGGRPRMRPARAASSPFQSTPSVWRETLRYSMTHRGRAFQSTPSVWRETTDGTCTGVICPISIHSLRVEGDGKRVLIRHASHHFNPLPPCGGRRSVEHYFVCRTVFQSTPSVWRETAWV